MRTASHSLGRWLGFDDDGLPPGPSGRNPFAVLALLRDPLLHLTRAREQYGDATCFRVGPLRFVSVANPDYAHHVLVGNHRNYVKSRNYAGLRLVMGDGLVTSEGEHWKRQRKLAQPAFHRQRLAALADTMSECVGERLDQWDQRAPANVDVHEEMMQLTLRIVGRTLFGTDLGTDLGALGPAVTTCMHKANEYAESLVRIPLWVPTPSNLRFGRAKRTLDAIVHGIIEQRRTDLSRGEAPRDDLLGMLMAATDEDAAEVARSEDESTGMTNQQLRDEVMTLFLAGHETIATAMSWTWMLLHQHPEVAARVREEATSVLGGRAARFEDLPRLVYTGQVIDEVLRLYPPAWIVERQALAEDRLGPHRIPAGTVVATAPWVFHRHPALWKDPLRFDPDRFAPDAPASLRERHKLAYMPFGAGPRICIGNHFALMEAKIILATVIQRYAVEVFDPESIGFDPAVTLRPRGGMRGRLHRLADLDPALAA
ncbi:cytochrome P450 [Paraliomyxa miuraensis]|uniref:cytochrome P450 n=1 Tax=Paraliomyxa miuraensis TaxID=376150 RepID=UPI0022576EDD|nr:cytochrome P450 [Paraliomyxa miuraensis]MCX4247963.1 cytochrome P450 [Paraliomyxa miuraensis]